MSSIFSTGLLKVFGDLMINWSLGNITNSQLISWIARKGIYNIRRNKIWITLNNVSIEQYDHRLTTRSKIKRLVYCSNSMCKLSAKKHFMTAFLPVAKLLQVLIGLFIKFENCQLTIGNLVLKDYLAKRKPCCISKTSSLNWWQNCSFKNKKSHSVVVCETSLSDHQDHLKFTLIVYETGIYAN